MLARHPFLDRVLELSQRLKAERLGELIVDRNRAGGFHRLHGDGKRGVLAGERTRPIVIGKFDVEGLVVAGLESDQVPLEARDELARADDERHVLAGAAFKRLAVE